MLVYSVNCKVNTFKFIQEICLLNQLARLYNPIVGAKVGLIIKCSLM